ncbi:Tetratricopeptide repeat-containing protein [Singulisphaera sp. GP187]|uniref:tetratricopeptide repeat protein n=1 Tax=Singulisphaera sp. GP187 TaxID=1882752 RepID=UPI000929B532|nr:tetratricopeptide repeat protein [Singulisphaera sp. GP187]SIO45325.1 Tetratricopeptide repeat-containing protein [Singulisphaera sp. GP187]
MAEKSSRRVALEQSLAEDPADSFLRYGLALQCLREGDVDEGRQRLLALIADHPEDQVAAYQQLGQSFMESGDSARAVEILRLGIEKAKVRGDWHAAGEMDGLLAQLGGN